MDKINLTKRILANAAALTATVYWVVNFLLILILPTSGLGQGVLGGISGLGNAGADISLFILGGISFVIFAWIFGYIMGWSLEYFSRKQ